MHGGDLHNTDSHNTLSLLFQLVLSLQKNTQKDITVIIISGGRVLVLLLTVNNARREEVDDGRRGQAGRNGAPLWTEASRDLGAFTVYHRYVDCPHMVLFSQGLGVTLQSSVP